MRKEEENALMEIAKGQAQGLSWPGLKKELKSIRELKKFHPYYRGVDPVIAGYSLACEARLEKELNKVREEGKYNVEYKLRPKKGLRQKSLEKGLSELGTSLDLGMMRIKTEGRVATIHLHTNTPEKVKELLTQAGKIENELVEDMVEQIRQSII